MIEDTIRLRTAELAKAEEKLAYAVTNRIRAGRGPGPGTEAEAEANIEQLRVARDREKVLLEKYQVSGAS